ncbi:hypothetical protein NKG94_10550 [Micromonospora sp. M12]
MVDPGGLLPGQTDHPDRRRRRRLDSPTPVGIPATPGPGVLRLAGDAGAAGRPPGRAVGQPLPGA